MQPSDQVVLTDLGAGGWGQAGCCYWGHLPISTQHGVGSPGPEPLLSPFCMTPEDWSFVRKKKEHGEGNPQGRGPVGSGGQRDSELLAGLQEEAGGWRLEARGGMGRQLLGAGGRPRPYVSLGSNMQAGGS